MEPITKKVNLNLIGFDGNAYSIMGAFRQQAKKDKWQNYEIEEVLTEAMNGDYNHLLYTIQSHCEIKGNGCCDEDDDFEIDEDDI